MVKDILQNIENLKNVLIFFYLLFFHILCGTIICFKYSYRFNLSNMGHQSIAFSSLFIGIFFSYSSKYFISTKSLCYPYELDV